MNRYTLEFKNQAVRLENHPEIETQDVAHALRMTAAVAAGTKESEAVNAFIVYLRSPEAAAVIRLKGMAPS